ncbi:MAG: hypothetical protein UU14_C0006G0014 [Candidatus Roizmanbacteria bacterium GW2011_GWB1_40_7]|uniref:DUF4258 domain-containing protein n=1 Tax=Candidatus Roizmanbacteria bacterium GW2011_GWB1_40_7 TaxID=1618482 RepID=A0A0G0VKE3_9BACT|nr:MAG: hypothetical protein UU14_C0006G0014 [Candidatus Roizmanbacteria bacterium GW2011_GWB1_40_7]
MSFRFTKHVSQKIFRIQRYGFPVNKTFIKQTIQNPVRVEERSDGTKIATSILDEQHCLRVVYRTEDDIIIIITCYPGRRKAYEV